MLRFDRIIPIFLLLPLSLLLLSPVISTASTHEEDGAFTEVQGITPPEMDNLGWTTVTNMPTAHHSCVTGWWNSWLYVAQGMFQDVAGNYMTNVCEAYNPILNSWMTKSPAPSDRGMVGLGQVQIGSILYSVGGASDSYIPLGTLESYDMATDTWTTLAPMNTPRYGHGVAAEGGLIYAFGSSNMDSSAESYHPMSNTWTYIAPMPVPQGYNFGASLNGKVYSFGGQLSPYSNHCYEYDPVSNTWTRKADLPATRKMAAAVGDPISGKIYVFGGVVGGVNPSASVIAYDPITDTWTSEGNMPSARFYPGACVDPAGDFYVVGGGSNFPSLPVLNNNTWVGTAAPPNVSISLVPVSPPIIIPPGGGSFNYTITVTNNQTGSVNCDVWIMAQTPLGFWVGPLLGPVNVTLAPGSVSRTRTQMVPGGIMVGPYVFCGYIGTYPTMISDSSFFNITQMDPPNLAGGMSSGTWQCSDNLFEPLFKVEVPTEAQLHEAYPNPFNPITSISFSLPEAGKVNLSVYDISGRLLATITNGWRDAGLHQVQFDAAGLSSGVYIYRMSAGDFSATGKMVLMK
jgi:N-acetylneuraminic acid mutarotase